MNTRSRSVEIRIIHSEALSRLSSRRCHLMLSCAATRGMKLYDDSSTVCQLSKHGDVDLQNQVLAAQPKHSDAPSHHLSTFNVVASTCQERGERFVLSLPCLTVAIHDYVLCADIGAWLTLRLAAVRHSRCQALARWISLHSQKPPTPCIFTA